MSRLVESNVELAAIEWFESLGYTYVHGSDNSLRGDLGANKTLLKKVVLESKLKSFIDSKYNHIPETARKEALSRFILNEGIELDYRNRDFHIKLSKGVDISWKDKEGKEFSEHVYAIDFENILNNEFLCVNQFSIEGKNNRRPDLIIFINGLSVALFEFKNMFDTTATVENAFNQIQHYREDIQQLFEYNEITVASDGTDTLLGMYSSTREFFTPWKSIDGLKIEEDDFALNSLIKGLFPKERILQYLRYFIFHEDHNGSLIKKGAKYHQFFGIQFAVNSTKKAIKPIGDGRIGVIWHTQGSGKSISMAFFTSILRRLPELKNPTIVVQVDRNDLDSQLYDNFILARDLVGVVQHAETTEELRNLLSSDGGGVIFTTIEKFRLVGTLADKELVHPTLSTRENIIVIADEAHRTQYGLLDGLAANLRKALPNASFIGFTGTPVDKKNADTVEVFGETIHVYDIKQAVEDKATVPIYYEPRLAKLHLVNEAIDEEAEEIIKDLPLNQANHIKWAAVEDAANSDDRVNKVATDILTHYINRTSTLPGKALIVCMSRRNCVKMYDTITKLEACPEIAVVMTGNISKDPKEWNMHIRTSEKFEAIKQRFKDPKDPLKIVIVRDMWLTGFDVPCLHTLYVDKIMQGHNLMQAIARVNRVFKDKPAGVIVDYIGIGDYLKDATKKYTGGGGKGDPSVNIEEAMQLCLEQLEQTKPFLPEQINYTNWKALTNGDKLLLISKSVNHIVKDDERSKSFLMAELRLSALVSIVKSHPGIADIALDIIYIQHVATAVRKVKNPIKNIKVKEDQIKELITRSIDSDEIVDVFKMAGIEKADISILNEQFLLGAKDQKSGVEIKVELLRRILENEMQLRQPKNIKKYISLKKELDDVIDRYHKNAIDSFTTIIKLIEQAKEMQEEDRRTKELGLTEEELAFYDIIALHENSITERQLIKDIVKNVTDAVKKNLQIDWYKKEDAKAAIRLAVKKELRGKVNLEELNQILAEIMEQAEGQYKEFPIYG